MNISILSVFPDLYKPFLATSLVRRAQEQGLVAFDVAALFSYVAPKERIDAPTFGPTAGMLLRPEVIEKAITDKQNTHGKALKIFFSPQGKKLTPTLLQELARKAQGAGHLMLVPARYEGMDARVEQVYADELISIGDFVLMGGDLPAMILIEGLLRFIPGVIGKEESVEKESFAGPFVDYPEYTAPVEWQGLQVPDIVRSGNHEAIRRWREDQAVRTTVYHHFNWLRSSYLTREQRKMTAAHMPPHYCVLMHGEVLIGPNERKEGTTSVTSVDIHDIARSASTYGLKNFFIVTPLADQQKIVRTLLNFWQRGEGIEYNPVRHEAVNKVRVVATLEEVMAAIEEQEKAKPLLLATSARPVDGGNHVTFYDHERVWESKRPVLFIFGTGQGLSPALIGRCDFILPPVQGFTDFNHLSVRSAAAIIFDRWLGTNQKA